MSRHGVAGGGRATLAGGGYGSRHGAGEKPQTLLARKKDKKIRYFLGVYIFFCIFAKRNRGTGHHPVCHDKEKAMTLTIDNISDIRRTARQFMQHIGDSTVLAFYGDMGAGKTTFIKALCEEMGVEDVITSPTFAIVNEYSAAGQPVYHFDFYRIKSIREVYDMGYEDYFYSGNLCLIEWPELIDDLLPDDAMRIRIAEQPDGRRTVDF